MPAVSKSQQKLFGMVHALKTGALKLSNLPDALADKVKKVAAAITDKAASEFAHTKGLTEKMTFIQFLAVHDVLIETLSDEEIVTLLNRVEQV